MFQLNFIAMFKVLNYLTAALALFSAGLTVYGLTLGPARWHTNVFFVILMLVAAYNSFQKAKIADKVPLTIWRRIFTISLFLVVLILTYMVFVRVIGGGFPLMDWFYLKGTLLNEKREQSALFFNLSISLHVISQ